MITLLHIENIAVIEYANIEFSQGFNILTGETGAGKSIIIDSVKCICGERTSREMIRNEAKSALVSAMFSDLSENTEKTLEDIGISLEYDKSLHISREMFPDGKNLCRINGKIAPLSTLREIGGYLINIHGQHDRSIAEPEEHLGLLDRYSKNNVILESYKLNYDEYLEIKAKKEKLMISEQEKARMLDMLNFAINEIESAELEPNEEDELKARKSMLVNSEKLKTASNSAYDLLRNSDFENDALTKLSQAADVLAQAAIIYEPFNALNERLNDCNFVLQDIAEELKNTIDSFEFSENDIDKIEYRLDIISRLKKKYGNSVSEILDYYDNCIKRKDEIIFLESHLDKLESECKAALKNAEEKANILTKNRKQNAEIMCSLIEKELAYLDMPGTKISLEFAGDTSLTPSGADKVEFYLCANAGEAAKPLFKIASGGELSRIMLALNTVLVGTTEPMTLIYDEIDTGISGRAATKVGEKLSSVAKEHQVLCVTHLSQMAAFGDSHLYISKTEKNGRTYTTVKKLSLDERVYELARITGGDNITPGMLQSAKELLSICQGNRNGERK